MASNAGSTSASTSTSAAPGQGKLAAKKTEVAINDEDDDLDELDDVLDQFGNAPSASLTGKASSNVTSATADAYDRVQGGDEGKDDGEGDDDDEDFEAVFAAELAKEMEKMLGSVKSSSGNATAGTSGQPSTAAARAGGAKNTNNNDEDGDDDDDGEAETEEERQFRETFEKILASTVKGGGSEDLLNGDEDIDLEELSKLMNGLGGGGGGFPNLAGLGNPGGASSNKGKGRAGAPKAASGPSNPPRTFEESIKATMSRLSESEAAHKDRSRGSGPDGSKDPMAALLAQMEAIGAGGGGGLGSALGGPDVDDENLPELLDGLMDQLMSKELLYEPISELKVKYPEYLASGEAASLSSEERARYEKQSRIVVSIAQIFESPDYDDSNKEQRESISTLMQQMQEAGAPPKHLLGELGPAMSLNPDGTPNVDAEQCVVS